MFTYFQERENEVCFSELFNWEMMYFRMLLNGQAQDNAAGDINEEQIPLLPSRGQIKQKGMGSQYSSAWKGAPLRLTLS